MMQNVSSTFFKYGDNQILMLNWKLQPELPAIVQSGRRKVFMPVVRHLYVVIGTADELDSSSQ